MNSAPFAFPMMKPIALLMLVGGALCATAMGGGLAAPADADNAVAQANAGNIDAAADAVSANNLAPKGDSVWYQQSALVLLDRAQDLKGRGNFDASQKAAAAAIRVMAHGLNIGGPKSRNFDRAEMDVEIAQIYEQLLGDRQSAISYYQQALTEEPDNATAKAALAAYALEKQRLQLLQGGTK